ncbi:type I-E CRISPR-associated protein Cas5/CasD [Methylobacterium sp. MA0201]|uniref:type I-E CRISPR-associated protein Cas5/CasD n=1 Tax=Methylobacterium alsaeris TaxID=3344826 RepID=UPI003756A965
MPDHLVLLLDAPLCAFGGDIIDAYGVVRDFPGRSTVTGLLANALGYDRANGVRLDRLQARLVLGSARAAEGRRVRDFQTARLGAGDRGWTTRGRIEGRSGGAATYDSPHIRYRDADADALVLVAFRLDPPEESPTLAEVEHALDRPERPLFAGRKPCLPSRPLLAGRVAADDVRTALERGLAACAAGEGRFRLHSSRARREPDGWPRSARPVRAQWPAGLEPGDLEPGERERRQEICDERDWVVGVHGGSRGVTEGRLSLPAQPRGDMP